MNQFKTGPFAGAYYELRPDKTFVIVGRFVEEGEPLPEGSVAEYAKDGEGNYLTRNRLTGFEGVRELMTNPETVKASDQCLWDAVYRDVRNDTDSPEGMKAAVILGRKYIVEKK